MSSVCERGVAGVLLRCGATPAAVYVSILSELGHVGDNITVQCRVVGVSDLVPRVRWVKSAVGDSAEQTVADGERIVAPYDRLARYFASLTPLSQVTLYLLTIYGEYLLWTFRVLNVDSRLHPGPCCHLVSYFASVMPLSQVTLYLLTIYGEYLLWTFGVLNVDSRLRPGPCCPLVSYFASQTPLSQVTLYHLNIYCESTRVGKSHDFKKTKNQIVCAAFFNKVLLRCSLRLILNE